ncbi:MAG: four helix bundle protein [Planctomycetes bacterium]|nr:four helix bundle protein [Planctomycetota bacterium]MBU4399205.1 four helix bundle protein [Planctomycetota bacterium]MCG2682094.1 four helix bundle protein [Planctomycetales bacterium]
MNSNDLRNRTKKFALRIIKLASALPRNRLGEVLGRQILKSGTSIGANYREALRASSRRHFVTTLEIAIREGEETVYWLELLAESNTLKPSRLSDLTKECDELVAILTATVRTTKRQIRNQKS